MNTRRFGKGEVELGRMGGWRLSFLNTGRFGKGGRLNSGEWGGGGDRRLFLLNTGKFGKGGG